MSQLLVVIFFFQAEDGIRDDLVTGVQTCALPIFGPITFPAPRSPYARLDGTKICHLEPTGISSRASLKPGMIPLSSNGTGFPAYVELSHSVPSRHVPL